jgi:hypothetical protein
MFNRSPGNEMPFRLKLPALALATGIGLSAITGCDMSENEQAANWKAVVTTYKGNDLYCRAYDTGSAKNAYDCDFTGYYAGNPGAPKDAAKLPDGILRLVPSSYNGNELDCLMYDAYRKEDGQTCDWPGYHMQNNAASSKSMTTATVPTPAPAS